MEEHPQIFVGIDIGGFNSKIVLISKQKLNIDASLSMEVKINQNSYNLYAYTASNFSGFSAYVQDLKSKLKGNIKVKGTGGASILEAESLAKLFGAQVKSMSEFQAHGKGLQFVKKTGLPLLFESFSKKQQGEIEIIKKAQSFGKCPDLLFVSLGSGVNYQIYGETETGGIQRKPAKDLSLVKGDPYFLQGTCLGAGFLMGISKLHTDQKNVSALLEMIKADEELKQYYQAVTVNLFQMAINLAKLHQQKFIFLSGGLLSFGLQITNLFKRALEYSRLIKSIELTIIRQEKLDCYLGALGALKWALQ